MLISTYIYTCWDYEASKNTPRSPRVSLYSTQPGARPLVLAPLLKMEELQQWAGNYRL